MPQGTASSEAQAANRHRLDPLRLFWMSDANSAHTERWTRELSQRGHEILLFSLVQPKDQRFVGMPGVRVETGGIASEVAYSADGSIRKLAYLRSIPRIRKLWRAFRPHVTHAHYASSYGLLAALAGVRPRIVSVWGADVYRTAERSAVHRMAVAWAIRSADCVLSTSWTMRDRTLELCNREISVVPFGIDIDRFAPHSALERKNSRITVGTIKSLEHKYGIEYLLRAFALLRHRTLSAELRLLIAGSGSQQAALQRLARELGIQSVVEFTGHVPYKDVHKMHQMLDIAVYPSVEDSESFGVSIIESQACAVPVIVSRIGGLPEVVEDGVTAIVTKPRDVEGLTLAMQTLIDDREFADKMGQQGRQRVVRMYELRACATLLEQHYRQHTILVP